ncbi:MAG: LysM peptidoglycan-binding domain-containing protein [Deltaproteobacteria bacterium]|nr:LysM peptidoglycan-binding domain-containing protein [Nannocystaceae bacterium]
MTVRCAMLMCSLALVVARPVDAQPAEAPPDDGGSDFDAPSGSSSGTTRRSSAIDAAYGAPPAGARVDPNTSDDPSYSSGRGQPKGDQTYGSTAKSVGTDGAAIEGYQILDGEYDVDDGYVENVPDVHVVQDGDTLWDISAYYIHDPYAWPRLWSWNEHITNAHWIFPGDRVRLFDPRRGPGTGPDQPNLRFSKTQVPDGAAEQSFMLNQTAFVDAAQFDTAMTVIGGGDATVMMSTLDTVYMSYDRKHPPVRGERLVVYAPQQKVRDLKDRKVIGYIVQIMGEVDVETIARKAAEGTIASAVNPVERGYKVGPLRRQFKRVETTPSEESATGLVVATLNDAGPIPIKDSRAIRKTLLGDHVLVGETQFLVVNLGSSAGLEVGNVLEVVRKGDEFTEFRLQEIPYDDGWPRRVIGSLVVLQVQADTALCATTYARREIERGDHVELRGRNFGAQQQESPAAPKRKGSGRASGNAQAGGGKVRMGGEVGSGK